MKILIPLDGSEIGEAALPYVETFLADLSPRVKLEFIFMSVVPLRSHYVPVGETATPIPYTEEEMEQIKQESRKYLEELSEGIKNKNIAAQVIVKVGNPADKILDAAEEMEVDLIAMSTHGRHGITRWAFGSVTDKVLRAGHKPVLVVRASQDKKQV
ncbi:universal stress protein [Chloroflexota bacterium]